MSVVLKSSAFGALTLHPVHTSPCYSTRGAGENVLCRYCVSVNNTIASFLGRYKDNEYLFWITKPMYWLFEFLGKTSARPPAKAYLAPYHMKARLS